MISCGVCGEAVAARDARAESDNCESAGHLFHASCLDRVDRYDPCPGCASSCRICKERAPVDEAVTLCDEDDHRYHEACLRVANLGPTSECPKCARDDFESRLAGPCAACGEPVRGVSWSVGTCSHGLHPRCMEPWDAGLVAGCIACGEALPICAVCDLPISRDGGAEHAHPIARCRDPRCRARVFDVAARDHDCDARAAGDKPCPKCGKASRDHAGEPCGKTIAKRTRWDAGRFLFACPMCSDAVVDLGAHFASEHRRGRCRRCGFAIAKHAAPAHLLRCGGSKTCPAEGCRAIVSDPLREAAATRPTLLWKDHRCSGLYSCPHCEARFYDVDAMNVHAVRCEPDARAPKRRRRAAFVESMRVVLRCSEVPATDE